MLSCLAKRPKNLSSLGGQARTVAWVWFHYRQGLKWLQLWENRKIFNEIDMDVYLYFTHPPIIDMQAWFVAHLG